jgi:hypothetical protein
VDQEARENLKESFASDMAEHQKKTGKLPTPAENARLAVPMFEMLEQKLADEAQRQALAAPTKVDPRPSEINRDSLRRECERRGRGSAADFLAIKRMPDKAPIAVAPDPADLERGMRMLRRVQLLMTKRDEGVLGLPSWAQRAKAVLFLKFAGADPRRIAFELVQLCEDSIPAFGPWDVPEGEGRPLIFT